jgi:hypothetical protein
VIATERSDDARPGLTDMGVCRCPTDLCSALLLCRVAPATGYFSYGFCLPLHGVTPQFFLGILPEDGALNIDRWFIYSIPVIPRKKWRGI